jgi:hypothetical protein
MDFTEIEIQKAVEDLRMVVRCRLSLLANTNGIIVVNGNKRNPSAISKILSNALLSIKLPEIQ